MNISLLVRRIVQILVQNNYLKEAELLEQAEYGATGGEIFGSIIQILSELKQNEKIYTLISDDVNTIFSYAKENGYL